MKISINNPLFKVGYRNSKLKKISQKSKKENILKVNIEDKKKIDDKKIINFEKNLVGNIVIKKENKKVTRNGYKKNSKEKIIYNKNRSKDKLIHKQTKLPKSYFTLLFSMFLLAGISVKLTYETYRKNSEEDFAVFSSNDSNMDNVDYVDNNIEMQDIETNNKDTIEEFEEQKEEVKKEEVKTIKVEPLVFTRPVNGNIQKLYSPDKVIYSKTLEMWKTHEGIDISANMSDTVKSIERGIVERIYEDAFLGTTVIIDHSQGYKSIYSNLEKDVFVKEKQTIIKGTKIGKIGKTSIGEYSDEPHLHFVLKYNNELVDPTYIFN